jgi:hypothetical protein
MKKKLTYTKREAFRLHQKMWRELAETGYNIKHCSEDVRNNCYLCQYVVDKAGKLQDDICRKHCPAIWPVKSEPTYWAAPCEESYYGLWRDSCFLDERQKLAKKIANLEYRKEPR